MLSSTPTRGDVQIFQNLTVVPDGEVENPNLQISLSDARADNDPERAEVGEEHTTEIFFLRNSDAVPSSTCVRLFSQRFSTCRKKLSMPSSRNAKATS